MERTKKKLSSSNKKDLYRYAGLGTQLLVSIGLAVFAGIKSDEWLHSSPLFSCALPLLVLVIIFYKLIRETGNKKNDESN
ncbi:MAG TPA: AtpZ/AtpI family protein [Chryseolinea sp.]|nr:AtpZ/AtpI family protein [Chryseolinea sp.]